MRLYSFFTIIFLFNIIPLTICLPVCNKNSNFCTHCNILTNLCAKCEKPDIFVPDEYGGCIGSKKCVFGKNYCNECDEEEKLCHSCEENYYPDENGGCAYSEGCEISYMGECLKCKSDFVLIGKENEFRFCKSIYIDNFKNCKEINYETGFCKTCLEGYYLTTSDHKCIKTQNCKESIFGECVSCNQGYYYNKKEKKCKVKNTNLTFCKQTYDSKNCEICEEDYYLDENGICVPTQFCRQSKNLICEKCLTGYLANNNICTNTDNCETADKITSICTYCKSNYYLDTKDYKCKSNRENDEFKYCKIAKDNLCLKCEVNYYLGEDLRCSNSEYCAESDNGECLACVENYHIGNDNKCIDIEKCIYSKFDSCLECVEGYYYNKLNKKCEKMDDKFLNCKYSCDDGQSCCECKEDFYLYENNSLCYDNTKEKAFIKCAYVDNSKENCKRCEEGYYLGIDDNRCSKIKGCKTVENENKCLECDKFYCLDVKNQECVNNDYLEDTNNKIYISCKRTNKEGTACEECLDGYEVNKEGYCVDINICEEKKNNKCLKCKESLNENGYQFCANEIFGCIESAHNNCLRCDNLENLYECTECKEGYIKSGYGCLKIDDN